jgi:hypothetical protein
VSLSFDQMESRHSTIKKAHSTTCAWFMGHPLYLDWIGPRSNVDQHGFLWLRGKPGAGKSTLMKFAYNQAQKTKPDEEMLITFFFNAREFDLQKSTVGIYRALLYQLFTEAEDLQELLDQVRDQEWTTDSLCELLLAAVRKLGQRHLRCFVDALDECVEEQVREMINFFEDLQKNACESAGRLSVCFPSRHYPTITIESGQKLILEDEPGHGDDIAKYVQRQLHPGKDKAGESVRLEVQEKATGMFLWVILVVNILNDEFARGAYVCGEKKATGITSQTQ